MDRYPITVDDFRMMLGLKPLSEIYAKTGKIPSWSNDVGKLDIQFARTEIRKREDGVAEMVIYIPFQVEGL